MTYVSFFLMKTYFRKIYFLGLKADPWSHFFWSPKKPENWSPNLAIRKYFICNLYCYVCRSWSTCWSNPNRRRRAGWRPWPLNPAASVAVGGVRVASVALGSAARITASKMEAAAVDVVAAVEVIVFFYSPLGKNARKVI